MVPGQLMRPGPPHMQDRPVRVSWPCPPGSPAGCHGAVIPGRYRAGHGEVRLYVGVPVCRVWKWSGRCGECQAWGTVEETASPALARTRLGQAVALAPAVPAVPITEVDAGAASVRPTGLDELDRVLGGGLVPGAVVLLAGEPGVGKSTLLLEAGALASETGTWPSSGH